MKTRTPEQEAAITAAISRLENLLRVRRGEAQRFTPDLRFNEAVRSAVVGAALTIVAEPEGGRPYPYREHLHVASVPGTDRAVFTDAEFRKIFSVAEVPS